MFDISLRSVHKWGKMNFFQKKVSQMKTWMFDFSNWCKYLDLTVTVIRYSKLDFSALTKYSEFDRIKHPGMQSLSSMRSLGIPDTHGPFFVISGLFGNSK